MLQPELKMRRDKIRVLMAQQNIDAALITCNVNLLYTYGRVVSGYLYLPPTHRPCYSSNAPTILPANTSSLSETRNRFLS